MSSPIKTGQSKTKDSVGQRLLDSQNNDSDIQERVLGPNVDSTPAKQLADNNLETAQAFELIWTARFDAVEKATGWPLQIKAFHRKSNPGMMLIDGSAAQMLGLGRVLLRLNDPKISGIEIMDPQIIVIHLSRMCDWHLKHNLAELSGILTKEEMDRIRMFRFIMTQEEMDTFIEWGTCHSEKKLRAINNGYIQIGPRIKLNICGIFLHCADNNLNETSHPATNRAKGINLALAEAIEVTHPYDWQVYHDYKKSLDTCVLKNPRNTLKHHYISNRHHANSCALIYDQDHAVHEKLTARCKALRDEKKQTSGGKWANTKVAPECCPTLPEFGETVSQVTGKENQNPLMTVGLGSTSFALDADLEPPPAGTQPIFHFEAMTQGSAHSRPMFPPSTCPPAFYPFPRRTMHSWMSSLSSILPTVPPRLSPLGQGPSSTSIVVKPIMQSPR
ncbi:hypothetical protein M422DRAFT_248597 [Sphaerobolus stellatus SS14]|nr:hypothetical protein M422DRAFT_248597 [Sphaerobolus stellatus SS14]